MDIYLSNLGIINQSQTKIHKLKKTTEALLRKLDLSCKELQNYESCRTIIAINLACLCLNIIVEKSKYFAIAPISKNLYHDLFIKCKISLGTIIPVSEPMEILGMIYGIGMKNAAILCLLDYKRLYLEQSVGYQNINPIDLDTPLYQCAAFFVEV